MPQPFFTIEMLAAKHGDALWVEYGTEGGRTRRVIVDGGPLTAYPALEARLARLPDGDRRVELLVVTHVDTDHIESMIRMLAMPRERWPVAPRDIWFNGYRHVNADNLGGREGEFISALIHRRAFVEWNRAFAGGTVVVPSTGPLPRIELEDGMVLTLLSPDADKLKTMARIWEKDLDKWKIRPGDLDAAWEQLAKQNRFHPGDELTLGPEDLTATLRAQLKGHDPSAANGSSIAFLAEFGGKSCLFLADAHMDIVCTSIRRLLPDPHGRLRVDAVKMAHHGSRNNLTPEFLALVDAEHFLFSTNGDRFSHPDRDAVEAVIVGATRRPTLWFNYRSPYTEIWEAGDAGAGAPYVPRYPDRGVDGLAVAL
jgi:beta-lactamase superfamily II metal-dependent hydrolase